MKQNKPASEEESISGNKLSANANSISRGLREGTHGILASRVHANTVVSHRTASHAMSSLPTSKHKLGGR